MMKRKAGKAGLAVAAVLCAMMVLTACAKELTIQVVDGNAKTEVTIKEGKTVADALAEAGVTAGEKDRVTPAADTKLTEEVTSITVERQITVQIKDGDNTQEVSFFGTTVEEALQAAGVTLDKEDSAVPAPSETVKEGAVIEIKRTTYKEEKKTEEIPFAVQEAYSESMYTGQSQVTQQGQNGQKEITYKITYIDGKETNREVVKEEVVKEPVPQIVTYGTAQYVQQPQTPAGVYEVSRIKVPGCADGSFGYYEIHMSDGSVKYEEYHE